MVRERFDAEQGRVKYRLAESPAKEIRRVEGILRGVTHVFEPNVDYRLSDNAIEWIGGGERPDENTSFVVNYSFGEPSGITDVNPGSVTRTIVEAIAREFEYFYAQMDQVYRSGFIDTASGNALDLVVSILGISRLPPQHATGTVVFGRETDPDEISIEAEAHLYDERQRYELKSTPVKGIIQLEGTADGKRHSFVDGTDFRLTDDSVLWIEEGRKPDEGSSFTVDYTSFQRIVVPVGTRISTYSKQPQTVREFTTAEEGALLKLPDGRWEAQIPVRAVNPGKVGNVPAGSITVMPHPPVGVEYVINREDIATGVEAESDEELSTRAKRALEAAGKATFTSLESAIGRVEGVKSLRIEDSPEGIAGIVRAVVDGGDGAAVEEAINDTRSAGIKVEFTRPKIAQLDFSLTVLAKRGASPSSVQSEVEGKIRDYIGSLQIGEDVIFSRIIKAILDAEQVYDVINLTVTAYLEDLEPVISSGQNLSMRSDERANARTVSISVKGRELEVSE